MKASRAGSGVVFEIEEQHKCLEPEPKRYRIGSVFKCDCGKTYTLADAQQYQGGPYWELNK